MNYAVRWSAHARGRLRDILDNVAESAPVEALRLSDRITARAGSPDESSGRGVRYRGEPEKGYRQLIEAPFRIIYAIDEATRTVRILAVQHMAQGLSQISEEAEENS